MKIANRTVGAGHPCFIAAEISGNHNGSLDRAIALIHAAKEAGADAVKFQAFTIDEILGLRGTGQAPPPWESMTLPELYAKAITPQDWFPRLFEGSRRVGLIPFASVFGLDSLETLESLDCLAYKIAKPERCVDWLLDAVTATGKPVFRSVDFEPETRDWTASSRGEYDIYCPDGYPPPELHLRYLDPYPGYPESICGLSCHRPDPLVGAVAVARGCSYLEFHLTLDDGVPTLDDCVNLTASQFREMVQLVRRAEAML